MGDPNTVNMRTCFALLVITAAQYTFAAAPPSRLFTCFNNTCVLLDRGSTQGSSLAVCLLTCGAGPVWPLPSKSAMDGNVSAFSRCSIHMQFSASAGVTRLLTPAGNHLVYALATNKQAAGAVCTNVTLDPLTVHFSVASQDQALTSTSDESYTLQIVPQQKSCACTAATHAPSPVCACEPRVTCGHRPPVPANSSVRKDHPRHVA